MMTMAIGPTLPLPYLKDVEGEQRTVSEDPVIAVEEQVVGSHRHFVFPGVFMSFALQFLGSAGYGIIIPSTALEKNVGIF
jgi:hypothetical protein